MNFGERLERIQALAQALGRQRDTFVHTAVQDLGFAVRDCRREFGLTMERLGAFHEAESLLADREPVCRGPNDEIALMLPYDGSSWLNIAILSIWLVGNRVRVKFSSKGSDIARFTEELYRPLFGDDVRFDYRPGAEFMEWALADSQVRAIVIFGSDRHVWPYREAVQQAGKKLVFEGPGNDPLILFDDADLDAALDDLVDGKYRYSGQTCTAPERILVQAGIYEQFLHRFADRTQALRIGDPGDPRTDVTPLASRLAVENIRAHLADAAAKGGRILCGGHIEGMLVEPTIVADATPAMRGMQEESFGPVSYVARFETPAEALALARDNRYGLRAGVWGGADAAAVAQALKGADYMQEVPDLVFGHFGTVGLNEPRYETWRRALITRAVGGYGYSGWAWETRDGRFVLRQGPKLLSVETSKAG